MCINKCEKTWSRNARETFTQGKMCGLDDIHLSFCESIIFFCFFFNQPMTILTSRKWIQKSYIGIEFSETNTCSSSESSLGYISISLIHSFLPKKIRKKTFLMLKLQVKKRKAIKKSSKWPSQYLICSFCSPGSFHNLLKSL